MPFTLCFRTFSKVNSCVRSDNKVLFLQSIEALLGKTLMLSLLHIFDFAYSASQGLRVAFCPLKRRLRYVSLYIHANCTLRRVWGC